MAQQESKRQEESGRGRPPTGQPNALQQTGGERRGGLAPWRGESSFERTMAEMDWMFDQMQRRLFGAPLFGGMMPWRGERGGGLGRLPNLELEDTGDAIVLNAEVPGVDPKDLHLEYRDDVLTIRAESQEEEGEDEGQRFRRYARFYSQVSLLPEADVDRAQASVKNGVLTVRFPKRADAQNVKRIPISAEGRREAA